MPSEVFQLAILISLKDAASSGLDRMGDRLSFFASKASGASKEARAAAQDTLRVYEGLRTDLQKGFQMGAIGLAGLGALKEGLWIAKDFEASMADLKSAIATTGRDGALDVGKLNDQMNRFRVLTMELGNQLPGTEQDFVQMFTSLKEGGLQTEAILKGAGRAVAELAIVTHAPPRELGKEFAQVGEMFQLKPEEYSAATDIFAKLMSVGLMPSELIEGGKFAQIRGGGPLGLANLAGLREMSSLMGVLRASGLEGGIGGRELGALLMNLPITRKAQRKADAELKAKSGISLEFFDKKSGAFLGAQNMVAQFTKLRNLKPEEMLNYFEKRFGGREAAGPASVFTKLGTEGWAKYKQRIDEAADRQQRLAIQTETFDAKLRNVLGTARNIATVTFMPLLTAIEPKLDSLNTFLGHVQEFAKEHSGLAEVATELFGIGSAALVVTAGIKIMRAGWGLWKIATAMGSSGGLLQYLGLVRTETLAVSATLTTESAVAQSAAYRMGYGMGRTLGRSFGVAAKLAVVAAIAGLVDLIQQQAQAAKEELEAKERAEEASRQEGKTLSEIDRIKNDKSIPEDQKRQLLEQKNEELENERKDQGAGRAGSLGIGEPNRYLLGLVPWQHSGTMLDLESLGGQWAGHPLTYLLHGGRQGAEDRIQGALQDLKISSPDQMAKFLEAAHKNLKETGHEDLFPVLLEQMQKLWNNPGYQKWVKETQEGADKTKDAATTTAEATKQEGDAAKDTVQPLNDLKDQVGQASGNFATLNANLGTINDLLNLRNGGEGGSGGHPGPLGPPESPDGKPREHNAKGSLGETIRAFKSRAVPSRAVGGHVESAGLVWLHPGEDIVPARATLGLPNDGGRRGSEVHHHTHHHGPTNVTINVPHGSRAADDPDVLADLVARAVQRQRERR